MRYVSYRRGDQPARPAVMQGDRLRKIDCESLLSYIGLDPEQRREAITGTVVSMDGVQLDAPLRPHKNIFCVGRNYLGHAREGALAAGRELKLPAVPTFFTKAPTAIVGPEAPVRLSGELSREYDWEGELAVIVGKRLRDVPEENALEGVFGYTCLNDITARDLQRAHIQWFKGKSLDDCCPLGPCVVGAEEVRDPQALQVTVRVNGAEKQNASTAGMIFTVRRIICELSKGLTLEPGDIIATGTPQGVGFARTPPEFFANDDVVEVEIQPIGILRNRIVIS
ncbi:MAG: fumarylacetoacetate hydrolase family protein [Candidatus Eremiobacteraeota bacterium]|nr:fumarylacetoacetate hydrolase family protein [Candidatus Eremiobacteraeota bacterium]